MPAAAWLMNLGFAGGTAEEEMEAVGLYATMPTNRLLATLPENKLSARLPKSRIELTMETE